MANAHTNIAIAHEYCKRFPKVPSKTLARKMFNEQPGRFTTFNAAYLCVRKVRGVQGKNLRIAKENRVPWKKRKAGEVPECPPSYADPWEPFVLDVPGRIISLSDLHVPYHSKEAIETAVNFTKRFKPDAVVLNGDILDFYRISRYEKDLSKRSLTEEILVGRDFLCYLRARLGRKIRLIYKLGNHDERWDKFIWQRCAEMFDLDNLQLHNVLHFDKLGIERVGDSMIMVGKLPILHGHELGRSIFNPVNPARGAFLRTKVAILVGHHHQTSSHTESDMYHTEIATFSQGCLSDLTPEYARVNRFNWGFASIDVDKTGEYDLHNYRISNNYKVRST